jgi:hypothetical protein
MNKSRKFMHFQKNKVGFSRVWFKLSIKRLFTEELLQKMVNKLFNKFRKGRSFFLIGKIKFKDNTIKTIHKGIVVTKSQNNDYLTFFNYNLSNKTEEDYNSEEFKEIIFEFYFIKKSRLESFILDWPVMKSELPSKTLNVLNHIPVNSKGRNEVNYNLWGNIIIDDPELKVIINKNYNYIIKP